MIQRMTIQGTSPGPKLLITGGVHGDEYEPMEAARILIQLVKPDGLKGSVTIAPVVNESAFLNGSRVAEDGLDLARTCPGNRDGTITHQIAAELSDLIRAHDYFIDMHTGGTAFRVHTLSGYCLHSDSAVLETQQRMAKAFNLPLVWGTTAKLEGRSLSVARDANVPAIYVEVGGGGTCEESNITACVEGCQRVMNELNMLQYDSRESCEMEIVEDPRDQSGHLQIQHPASATGFYRPSVTLGQKVKKGHPSGVVVDAIGNLLANVVAAENGIVVLIRAQRRVKQGEPLMALASRPQDNPGDSV